MSTSKKFDSDNKKDFTIKNAKYADEQLKIFNKIKKKIKYDDENNSFFVDEIDREFIIDVMYPIIKKYFNYDVYGRIDYDNKKSHISLVKRIFLEFSNNLILKVINSIDDNGTKIKRKIYYVV